FHEPESCGGVETLVQVRLSLPELLRLQPLARRSDPARGDSRVRAQPLHAAGSRAQHELILAGEAPQRQPEERERKAGEAVGGPALLSETRARAQVQIEAGDLVRRGLPHQPGGEERLAALVEQASAAALA